MINLSPRQLTRLLPQQLELRWRLAILGSVILGATALLLLLGADFHPVLFLLLLLVGVSTATAAYWWIIHPLQDFLEQIQNLTHLLIREQGEKDYLRVSFRRLTDFLQESVTNQEEVKRLLDGIYQRSRQFIGSGRTLAVRLDHTPRGTLNLQTGGSYLTDRERIDLLWRRQVSQGNPVPPVERYQWYRRKVAILFADARGFTEVADEMEPGAVVELLNEYYGDFVRIIQQHGGLVDKFLGDGMMAVFGVEDDSPSYIPASVQAAIALQRQVEMTNGRRLKRGEPTIGFGIGISTGEVALGHLGSEGYREFTAIGREVNLAAHISHLAASGQIMITSNTNYWVRANFATQELGMIQVKGIAVPIMLFHVLWGNA